MAEGETHIWRLGPETVFLYHSLAYQLETESLTELESLHFKKWGKGGEIRWET